MSPLSKILFLLANSILALGLVRIVERLGKSFRGPPRDAWLSEVAAKEVRGYSFGIHKALDKAGAILGPIIAYLILSWFGQNVASFKIIFTVSAISALGAVIVLFFMHDRPGISHEKENIFKSWTTLSSKFKIFLWPASIFALAYFSFGFLLLKAYAVGFAVKDIVLLYALFNISFVAVSAPIGKLGDIIGRKYILILGYLSYLLMSLGFIFATQKWQIIVLFIIFGIFYSIDEGQSKAFIADLEGERRATAIGIYNFITGIFYFFASIIAGVLWTIDPNYSFVFACLATILAMIIFAIQTRNISQ